MQNFEFKHIRVTGKRLTIDLPDNLKNKFVDVTVNEVSDEKNEEIKLEQWRVNLLKIYDRFKIDLNGYKFNRNELYDR